MKCECGKSGLPENTSCPECNGTLVKKPYTVEETIMFDTIELRDIAQYFDDCGKKTNGDFLRSIAHKLEIIYGAYRNRVGESEAEGLKI